MAHRDDRFGVWLWRSIALAAAYALTGRLGLLLAPYHDTATLIWPPTGLALAALVLFGLRLWPGVIVGCLLLNAWGPGLTAWAAFSVAVGNTLEAFVGAALLVRVLDFRPALERVRDVISLIGVGLLGCTMISATVGLVTLRLSGRLGEADPGIVWLHWWLGDLGGAVTVAPLLFMAFHGGPPWRDLLGRAEYWLALGAGAATGLLEFGALFEGPSLSFAAFSPFPVLVWAGTRLGSRGAVTVSLCLIELAVAGTVQGVGPFAVGDENASMLLLWGYAVTMSTIALTLSAAIGQRDRAEARHRAGEAERLRVERERLLLVERERITREMHDGIGGQLVSIISMLQRGRGSPAEMVAALRGALDDMRILIDAVAPEVTDLPTSLGKLRARLESRLSRSGVRLTWAVPEAPALESVTAEVSLQILRIIQEAVANALQHARAAEIEVTVSLSGVASEVLEVAIRDDGGGFSGEGTGGRGLRNIEARVASLGGSVRIESGASGTNVGVCVPVQPPV